MAGAPGPGVARAALQAFWRRCSLGFGTFRFPTEIFSAFSGFGPLCHGSELSCRMLELEVLNLEPLPLHPKPLQELHAGLSPECLQRKQCCTVYAQQFPPAR